MNYELLDTMYIVYFALKTHIYFVCSRYMICFFVQN